MKTANAKPGPLHPAIALPLYVLASLLLGSFLSVFLISISGDLLLQKGPDQLMRRCSMLGALILLPWLLRIGGWRGWRDGGFGRPALIYIGKGFLLGVVTLGGVGWAAFLSGARIPSEGATWSAAGLRALEYALSAAVVALVEETVCRGILFRVFARAWIPALAAAVISLLFALAHFVRPAPDAFLGPPVAAGFRVFLSSLAGLPRAEHFAPRLLNLFLLGLVLCAFVVRTGTIWLGVGAHAGWIWVMKMNGGLTDINRAVPWTPGLGCRGDTTDSLLATAVLLALLLSAWRRKGVLE